MEEMTEQETEVARKLLIRETLFAPVAFVVWTFDCLVASPVLVYDFLLGRVTPSEFGDRFAESGWGMWNLFWGAIEAFLILPIIGVGWVVRQVGAYSGLFAIGALIGAVVSGVYLSFFNPEASFLMILSIVWAVAMIFAALVLTYVAYAVKKIEEEEADER